MKRKLAIFFLYIVIIIIFLTAVSAGIIPIWYWNKLPSKPLNVWILDKTVPVPDYREHKGLMWVLNHNKIVWDKTGRSFRYDTDFYGFFPVDENTYDIRNIPSKDENPDLIYITDTYGVYNDDYLMRNVKGTRSGLIYGGLQTNEMNILKKNLHDRNTIIAEFNVAASPTNKENREELENIFGLRWKGWKGRYFRDLKKDLEVPVWMSDNYEKQYGKPWKFTGPGFALVSDDDKIIVLENNRHIGKNNLLLTYDKEGQEEFGIKEDIPYYYWFEFLEKSDDTEQIAHYTLDLTEEGKKELDKVGLQPVFPAILRYKNSQYNSYYFAGDFADMQRIGNTWNYYGLDWIRRNTIVDSKGDSDYFFWKAYAPMMKKIIGDIENIHSSKGNAAKKKSISTLPARISGKFFETMKDGKWQKYIIKGVNIGGAKPGKWFTEPPKDLNAYADWFEKIGEMNANTVRVYTLQNPQFYRALLYYNQEHPQKPLRLLQEIWPEEVPENKNYLDTKYENEYKKEIENAVDAIHGNKNIPERKGRAYGIYTADVSNYVLGYLVGRELEPEEVIETDRLNQGYKFNGRYLKSGDKATPTETWLAENCDYVLEKEESKYGCQHPVAIVSWPTLDPLSHSSEWDKADMGIREYNDRTSVDINNIDLGQHMKAGFFGAYHIYPNYPDFMNNEKTYAQYTDESGELRYGGYLSEFIKTQTKYPALVAEFGLATGMGNAHANPNGLNHGGLSEEAQGDGIVRMMKTILKEEYAGALIFEWMDEWAKKTWTTEPYMIPYERHVIWHNIIDPEQNYGILSYEPLVPENAEYSVEGNNIIKKLEMKKNEEYLFIDIKLTRPISWDEKVLVGIDTFDRLKGAFKLEEKSSVKLPTGVEFLIEIDGAENSRLLTEEDYDISKAKLFPNSKLIDKFVEIKPIINNGRILQDGTKIEPIYENGSYLRNGDFVENDRNNWYWEGYTLHLRLPWGRLNFSDPTTMQVLKDERKIISPLRDELKTQKSDGIIADVGIFNKNSSTYADVLTSKKPFSWDKWDVPLYTERLKTSYKKIMDYYGVID